MLKRPTLVALTVVCCAAIAALEALRFVTSSRTISPEYENVLHLAKYMPTLGVIAISFAFRAVATDVKKLTPWSNMSGRWATGRRSLLLDYSNEIEVFSVFRAIARKDRAVTVILAATFLCGALVPLANSLVYIDLAASRTVETTMTRTSVFDFKKFPLVISDGNLTIPHNYTGEKPYAHVLSGRESGGNPAPWTTGKYAFDRFSLLDSASKQNGTMTADVNAVAAGLKCEQAPSASCPSPFEENPSVSSRSWLNITQCPNGPSDLRISAIIQVNQSEHKNVGGVVCSPTFTRQRATVSVNISSNELVDFTLIDEPQPIDINTSIEALWLYLINPLDRQIMKAYGQAGRGGPYNADQVPVAKKEKIIGLVNELGWRGSSTDTFTSLLPVDTIGDLTRLDDFQREVELLATGIWVQVINLLSRKPVERIMPGTITLTQKRILVWEVGLRIMQALFALLAIICITFCIGLRPSTVLDDDPGSLAATSLVLADSKGGIEELLAHHATSSQNHMQSELRDVKFRFGGRAAQGEQILVKGESFGDEQPSPVKKASFFSQYLRVPGGRESHHTSQQDPGWRPILLHMASKIALLTTIVLLMVALALMLWSSHRHDGITTLTRDSSVALPLVTSTILVLLGYTCSGVDGVVQALAPFNVMRRRPNKHGIFIDYHSALGRLSGLGSMGINVALIASSVVMLIIPALKVVAAGLFVTTDAQRAMQVNITLDQSLVTNLHQTFNVSDGETTIRKACQYAGWEADPSFELPTRPGVIGNLVFSNITGVLDNASKELPPDGMFEARVPAILVDIHCVPIPPQNFNLNISYDAEYDEQPWTFGWSCGSQFCRDSLNRTDIDTSSFKAGGTPFVYNGATGYRDFRTGMGIYPPRLLNGDYILYLIDYSSVFEPFTNRTKVGRLVVATPETLNVSLPTMEATVCHRNLSSITVKTTFTRPKKAEIGGQEILLPWRPVSYDNNSIVYNGSYPTKQPTWFAPPIPEQSQYLSSSKNGELASNTLWPGRGSSTNFFELLAVHAEFQRQNLSSLLDPKSLAQSTQQMYTAYVTQLLTELRSNASSPLASQQLEASLSYAQARIMQKPGPTYVLEALLGLIMIILIWIFRLFPSKAILSKPPTSIAAQISLLADSTLVRRARDEKAGRVSQLKGWKAFAALGWWPKYSPAGDRMSGWRWGIDIGQDAQLQNWSMKPTDSASTPP